MDFAVTFPGTFTDNINNRLLHAKMFVDRLYKSIGDYHVVKDYPGLPLAIKGYGENDKFRPAAWQPESDVEDYFGRIWAATGPAANADYLYASFCMDDEDPEGNTQPYVIVYRTFNSDGTTSLQIQIYAYNSETPCGLYFDGELIADHVENLSLPHNIYITVQPDAPVACQRYTLRPTMRVAQRFYEAWSSHEDGEKLGELLDDLGFTVDIFDPIFGASSSEEDGFIFSEDAFHDWTYEDYLGRDNTQFPNALSPAHYPYESNLLNNHDQYICCVAPEDPKMLCLQAIHILNKHQDPDYEYVNPIEAGYITPTEMARYIEDTFWMSGVGIKKRTTDDEANSVATNVFLILETILGYGYSDSTSADYADEAKDILMATQIGASPNSAYCLPARYPYTGNYTARRPQWNGAQLLRWVPNSSTLRILDEDYYSQEFYLDVSGKNILDGRIGMYIEERDPLYSCALSTLTFIQALRTYQAYANSIAYPNSNGLPG